MTSMDYEVPRSLLETTQNTRDLGGYRSGISGKDLNRLKLLRSDIQNYPSETDIAFLKSRNIRTVIDMRGTEDVRKKPSGFSGREGFSYRNIPIEEGSGVPESADLVSASYLDIAESANIARVYKTIAAAPDGVMFNCTAGKDRTGVVSAVILGLCGVSDADIVFDYMLTKSYNRERFEAVRRNFPDLDMNIVIPQERYMTEFLSLLRARYGDFREYLRALGVTEEEINGILAKML